MGLFSFLKDAGSKLFSGDKAEKARNAAAEAADATERERVLNENRQLLLRGVVDSLNVEVSDLDLNVNGDQVTVYGTVTSQADREKIILAIGNTAGIATVDDRMNVEAEEEEPEATFYEVQRGDSLSKIAKAHYGDAMKYMLIFEANQPMLEDPDKIYPGQTLRIPQI